MAESALDHPDTRHAWSRQRWNGRLRLSAGLLAIAAEVGATASGAPTGVVAVGTFVAVAAFVVAFVSSVGLSRLKRMRRVLAVYAWTRYEANDLPNNGTRHKLITLSLGDGRTSKRFIAPWSGEPRITTDGTPVWFAGDSQFGGVIAPVGGGRILYAAPVNAPYKERRKRRNGNSPEDALARQAGLLR